MKRVLALILALVMALGMAACAEKQPEETKAPETNGTESADVETTEAPAPVEKKHVVYWSMWNENEPQGAVLRDAAKAFNEEHDNAEIEVVFQGRNISQVLVSALEAGTQVDIFDSPSASLTYAKEGVVLEDLINQKYPTTGDKTYAESVNGSLLDIMRSQCKDGKLRSIPYLPFVMCIHYNADHFAEAGITEIPTTWEDFMAACEKLKAKGYAPLTTDDAYCDTLPGMYMARAKGSEWILDNIENPATIISDPMFVQMAKAYEEMATKGYFHENAWANKFPQGQQDLATGVVSMYLNGTWLPNEIKPTTGPDFNWGMMAFPTVPGGSNPITEATVGGQEFMISNRSEVVEEAFEFIAYVTTGEWDEKLANESMQAPVGVDAKWPEALATAEPIFSNVSKNIPWSAGLINNQDFAPKLRSEFNNLIGQQITAEQFLENLSK